MPPDLPPDIQRKLDLTLQQWQQWHCEPAIENPPTVVSSMSSGISNYSILVESGQRFVVRIDGINPSTNGLHRQSEWQTLQAACRAGLAPHPCYFNPDLGSLVCDFLPTDDQMQTGIIEVATLLHSIHQLPARHHRLNLKERILRYEKLLEHKGRSTGANIQGQRGQLDDKLNALLAREDRPVLCHNDLLQANRIRSGGRLWAIDWEYCAMGSKWYDLAVVVNGDSLPAHEQENLLAAYLQRTPNEQEHHTLHFYGCVYRYLELLWYLALERPLLSPQALLEKEDTLLGMLRDTAFR